MTDRPAISAIRDLPIVSARSFDDVGAVRRALLDLENGQLHSAAELCDAFGSDDRIKGVLDTRVDALGSLPLELEPRGDMRRAEAVCASAELLWGEIFPTTEIKRLHRCGLNLGVGFARIEPEYSGNRWLPRLRYWDARYCRWRWDSRSYWTTTADGEREITPGRDGWVVYAPSGLQRGWMDGLVRSLALLFLSRRWAFRDWNRHSEVHGMPIRLGVVPANASDDDKNEFIRALDSLGSESTVKVPRDENNVAFDLKLVEAAAQSSDCFRQLIEKTDECIAVSVLGQNLTTSMKSGGSYAAANVHDRIRMDRLEADAKSLGPTLHDQVLRQWAEWNFGDPELAPGVNWSTKAPEDRAATASTLNQLGDALNKLRAAGLNIDREAIAKQFRIPLVAGEPTSAPIPAPQAPTGATQNV